MLVCLESETLLVLFDLGLCSANSESVPGHTEITVQIAYLCQFKLQFKYCHNIMKLISMAAFDQPSHSIALFCT
jgi:hypothetical protein